MCTIVLSKGEKHYVINANAISHIKASDKSCDIFLITDNQKFTENHGLSHFENKLAESALFIKLGRNLLVNRQCIALFTRHELHLKGNIILPINETTYSELLSILG
jgi:DNA-binding LytR/AlgR family response regulator